MPRHDADDLVLVVDDQVLDVADDLAVLAGHLGANEVVFARYWLAVCAGRNERLPSAAGAETESAGSARSAAAKITVVRFISDRFLMGSAHHVPIWHKSSGCSGFLAFKRYFRRSASRREGTRRRTLWQTDVMPPNVWIPQRLNFVGKSAARSEHHSPSGLPQSRLLGLNYRPHHNIFLRLTARDMGV